MSLLTSSTNSINTELITNPSLLEEDCCYKIRMDDTFLKNGKVLRYMGKKVLSNVNNTYGLNGVFYHFILDGVDEYFGEIWISLYTFEKVNQIRDNISNSSYYST